MIAQLDLEASARLLSDFLFAEKVPNTVDSEENNQWAVWVHEDDDLDRATQLLAKFRQNPNDFVIRQKAGEGQKLRAIETKKEESLRSRFYNRSTLPTTEVSYPMGMMTLILIILSAVVFMTSNSSLGGSMKNISSLFISFYQAHPFGTYFYNLKDLVEVSQGQVWRLFTPMFIHFDFLHILFNMMWLRDLGSMIEYRSGSAKLLLIVLVISGLSNVAQFVWNGPQFGGMSGVVYGLLGYIWIRSKFDPGSGLYLHPTTVWMMIAWFFLCMTGMVGHVANVAHGGGLVTGMAWGYLAGKRFR